MSLMHLTTFDWRGHAIAFTQTAYVNLTEICADFGKRPGNFLQLESTNRFIVALAADTGLSHECNCTDSIQLTAGNPGSLLITIEGRGGGTWAHPDLALECARWLSPEFAIWTNRTIRRLLSGEGLHSAQDYRELARLRCSINELRGELAEKQGRLSRLTFVPGNVSLWAYMKTVGVSMDKLMAMSAARAAARLCQHECLPVGTVRQHTHTRSKSATNTNRTFPPEVLCRVLGALGFAHELPALSTIMAAWLPMLPLEERSRLA